MDRNATASEIMRAQQDFNVLVQDFNREASRHQLFVNVGVFEGRFFQGTDTHRKDGGARSPFIQSFRLYEKRGGALVLSLTRTWESPEIDQDLVIKIFDPVIVSQTMVVRMRIFGAIQFGLDAVVVS